MSTESKTPRTDATQETTIIACMVSADFARQLERELIEAKESMTWAEAKEFERHAATKRELINSLARERQLREALEPFGKLFGDVSGVGGGTLVAPTLQLQLFKDARSALALPPPPVIPLDDVKTLVAAIEDIEPYCKAKYGMPEGACDALAKAVPDLKAKYSALFKDGS